MALQFRRREKGGIFPIENGMRATKFPDCWKWVCSRFGCFIKFSKNSSSPLCKLHPWNWALDFSITPLETWNSYTFIWKNDGFEFLILMNSIEYSGMEKAMFEYFQKGVGWMEMMKHFCWGGTQGDGFDKNKLMLSYFFNKMIVISKKILWSNLKFQ